MIRHIVKRMSQYDSMVDEVNRIRDRELGKDIFLTAHLHMIVPCMISPKCNYCSLSSSIYHIKHQRDSLVPRELIRSVKFALKRKEITSLTLVGGTDIMGQDGILLKILEEIRRITDVDLAIDVGAPISRETLEIFKENNLTTIYSSLETVNPTIFLDAKPGDSLDKRIRLLKDVDGLKMNAGTIIMNGLGNKVDVKNSIDFLTRFKNLKHLYFSTFSPVRGTPWYNKEGASLMETLQLIPYSRRIFPKSNIGLADVEIEGGSISGSIVKELEVGGGNMLAGMLIYKNKVVDYVDRMLKLEKIGYKIVRRSS